MKAANRYGVTPLSLACTNGNAAMVELLLKAGADPNTALPGGETALMTAARTGKVDAVKALLAHGADVNAKEPQRGQTALMWAAAEGNVGSRGGADRRRAPIFTRGSTPASRRFSSRCAKADRTWSSAAEGRRGRERRRSQPPTGRVGQAARRAARRVPARCTSRSSNAHYELAAKLLDAGADPNAIGPGLHGAARRSPGSASPAAATTIPRPKAPAT